MLRPNDLVDPGEDLSLRDAVDGNKLGHGIVEALGAGLDPCCQRPPCRL